MQISNDKIIEIKTASDIVDIILETVDLKLAGKDYIGLCPFHDEKTPSFTVSRVKQMWFCFGCGTGGDVIEYLIKKNNISFLDAAKQLADRYGIHLPEISTATTHHGTPQPPKSTTSKVASKHIPVATPKQPAPPSELWQEKAGKFASWAHEKLLGDPTQLKILANRGIKLETVKHFHLGYNPGLDNKDLFRPRESWGLATEMKEDRKKKLWLPVGLVIPMFSGDHVHRVRIRRPDGSKPSYYVIEGSSMATWIMKTSNKVYVIVESELDGILLWQEASEVTGIISMGSASTHPDPLAVKLLNNTALILNALDFDTAGGKALKWWDKTFLNSERWPVPIGKDPGEASQAGVDLKEWIIAGFPQGWPVGHFSVNHKKKEKSVDENHKKDIHTEKDIPEAGVCDKDQSDSHTGSLPIDTQQLVPSEVYELEKLLKKYPVSIYATEKEIRLKETKTWVVENWKISQQISNLVFMTPVMGYISTHPATLITGKNLILNRK